LSRLKVSECKTEASLRAAMSELEAFIESHDFMPLSNPKDFRQAFDSVITPATNVSHMFLCLRLILMT